MTNEYHFSDEFIEILEKSKILANEIYPNKTINHQHILIVILSEQYNMVIEILNEMKINVNSFKEDIIKYALLNKDKGNIGTLPTKDFSENVKIFLNELNKKNINYGVNSTIYFQELIEHNLNNLYSIFLNHNITDYEFSKIISNIEKIDSDIHFIENNQNYAINEYCVNMNKNAKSYDDLYGREKEINNILSTILRPIKKNAILIGKEGVGKTVIIEYIAKSIQNKNCPEELLNKTIYSLDVNKLVSGTQYRGQFEQRLTDILTEFKNNKNFILFIDEAHITTQAGNGSSDLNIQNVFKPAMARGELQVIMATTIDEYKRYMKKDKAFLRRCEIINISEPDKDMTINILKKVLNKYKNITYEENDIFTYCFYLADNYINHSNFPDKAIDIFDATIGRKKLLKNEKFNNYKKDLEYILQQKKQIIKTNNYELAPTIKLQERELNKKIMNEKKPNGTINLTKNDLKNYIEDKYNIILNNTDTIEDNIDKLKYDIIGQDEAINDFYETYIQYQMDVDDVSIPTYFFLGKTGIGKTFLSEKIAEYFYNNNFLKIDCGELKSSIDKNKLIGSPPSYVGYEEGGILTEFIKNNSFSVILFDEIEKAHHSIYDFLLGFLDKKYITDNKGEICKANNCLIIFTSNIGVSELNRNIASFKSFEDNKDKNVIKKSIENYFKPEFINRIDKFIHFNSLTKVNLKTILLKMYNTYKDKILLKYPDVNIILSDERIEEILSKVNSHYGAREIKRLFNTKIKAKILISMYKNKKEIIL